MAMIPTFATFTPNYAKAYSSDYSRSTAEPFKLKYAPHFGMFENSAGKDPIDQLKFMADNGFLAMEDNGMMGRTPELQTKIGDTLSKLGMSMGVFVVAFDNWPVSTSLTSGNEEWRNKFIKACKEAVEVAKRVNAKWMTVVPGNYERKLPMGLQTAIQHHLAEIAGEMASVDTMAMAACLALDARGMQGTARNARFEIAAAKCRASEAVEPITRLSHQVHGAIGFTYEYDLQFLTRRLWSWRAEFGAHGEWGEYLGQIAMDQGGDQLWQYLSA